MLHFHPAELILKLLNPKFAFFKDKLQNDFSVRMFRKLSPTYMNQHLWMDSQSYKLRVAFSCKSPNHHHHPAHITSSRYLIRPDFPDSTQRHSHESCYISCCLPPCLGEWHPELWTSWHSNWTLNWVMLCLWTKAQLRQRSNRYQ